MQGLVELKKTGEMRPYKVEKVLADRLRQEGIDKICEDFPITPGTLGELSVPVYGIGEWAPKDTDASYVHFSQESVYWMSGQREVTETHEQLTMEEYRKQDGTSFWMPMTRKGDIRPFEYQGEVCVGSRVNVQAYLSQKVDFKPESEPSVVINLPPDFEGTTFVDGALPPKESRDKWRARTKGQVVFRGESKEDHEEAIRKYEQRKEAEQ